MKRLTSLIILSYLFIFVIFLSISFSSTRRININIISKEGQSLYLYKDYHAPFVEIRNYEKRRKPNSFFQEANWVVAKPQPDKQQRGSKLANNTTNTPLEIKDITFNLKKRGKEIVAIYANHSFKHTVFFLGGYPPRIVIDIRNVSIFRKNLDLIPVDGKLIKRIRCHFHKDTKTLRIVLDVSELNEHYEVNQFFFEGNNVYVIEVIGKEKANPTELKGIN